MKNGWTWLPAILLSAMLLLSGCSDIHMYATYGDAVRAIDNDYFKTKVICESKDGSIIIQNEITGEYFLMIHYPHGVDLTPIQMRGVDSNESTPREGDDGTSSPEDYCNSKSESMSSGS